MAFFSSDSDPLLPFIKIRMRSLFIHKRHDLIRVDPNHEISNVVVDLGELMPRASRDYEHVACLQLMGSGILDVSRVTSRTVEKLHGVVVGRSCLTPDQSRTGPIRT